MEMKYNLGVHGSTTAPDVAVVVLVIIEHPEISVCTNYDSFQSARL